MRLKYKSDTTTGCWNWTGTRNKGGYGTLTTGSRKDKSRKTMLAHRVAYEVYKGSYDTSLKVCHTCDNRVCVNPSHLFLGTQKDNVADCIAKGRFPYSKKGEANPRAKLTKEIVLAIREKLSKGAYQTTLAKEYGVNQTLISAIKLRRIWK